MITDNKSLLIRQRDLGRKERDKTDYRVFKFISSV